MKNKPIIFVIEDEEDICELIEANLSREGFELSTFQTAEEGLSACKKKAPELLLLDIMLPGIDGLELCRVFKADADLKKVPIILVTAKDEEIDIVKGLELGADDYITKPFNPKVLIARVKAVLRRNRKADSEPKELVEIHELSMHTGRHEAKLAGELLSLTSSEFLILHFLASHPGWVFTRSQIVSAIRGGNYAVTERSIDVQIVGLRKKMGSFENYIETVRGVGYRFKE